MGFGGDMRRMTIAGVLALGLSSGLQANEPYAVTPDGATEAVFAMLTAEASIDIANTCRQRGLERSVGSAVGRSYTDALGALPQCRL